MNKVLGVVNAVLGDYCVIENDRIFPLKKSPPRFDTEWLDTNDRIELLTEVTKGTTGPWVMGWMIKGREAYFNVRDSMDLNLTHDVKAGEKLTDITQLEALYSYALIYAGWKNIFIKQLDNQK